MKLYHKLGRRGVVRLISFSLALIAALIATAVGSFVTSHRFRTSIEYSYQRALSELNEYVNSIDVTLQKGKYATTRNQMQSLSAKLWQSSGYAKGALAQLPIQGEEMEGTYKFLSQVGEFCLSLTNQMSEGDHISNEEITKLEQLSEYASGTAEKLRLMVNDVETRNMKIGEVTDAIAANKNTNNQEVPAVSSGFREIEEGFTDYPTMIYDGPFSDHIQQQTPKFLEGKEEVSVEKAQEAAQSLTGCNTLKYTEDVEGNLPCFNYTADQISISVTKAGGYVDYLLNSREIAEPVLSKDEAIDKAKQVLDSVGFTDFVYRYYSINSGVLTVNYAATQDGVVLYPDLVKVGIALDDGSVVSYDAKGYLLNHTHREIPAVKITEQQAKEQLSSKLKPLSHSLVLIPAENLTEVLCHEFLCEGQDGERVLVYSNVQTGMEEKILIVLQDETGVLAM